MRVLCVLMLLMTVLAGTASAEDWASLIARAKKTAQAGHLGESEDMLRRALVLAKGLSAAEVIRTHEVLAAVLAGQEKHQSAIEHYSSALRMRESLESRTLDAEALCLNAIAASLRKTYRLEKALGTASLAVKRAIRAGHRYQVVLAKCRYQLALVLSARRELGAAESEVRKALLIYSRELPAGHSYIARCYLVLGGIQLNEGMLESAHSSLTRAQKMFAVSLGKNSEWARSARCDLATVHLARGKLGDAKRELEDLAAAGNRTAAADEAAANARLVLAGIILDSGVVAGVDRLLSNCDKYLPIATCLRRAQVATLNAEWKRSAKYLDDARTALHAGVPVTLELVTHLHAEALIREGRAKEALSVLLKNEATMRRASGNYHCLLAAGHLAEGQPSDAAASARAALQKLEQGKSLRAEIYARAEILLGDALLQLKDPETALESYERARKRIASLGMPMPELTGCCLLGLGRIERRKGHRDEAVKLLGESADSFKKGAPVIRRQAGPVLREMAVILAEKGDKDGAEKARKEASSL